MDRIQSVKLWDVRSYQQVKTFACAQKIMCLSLFGEQGVAVGCIDRTVRVSEGVNSMVSCASHRRQALNVNDAESISPQLLMPPHYDAVQCLTGAENLIFSGSRDFSIKQWRKAASGKWECNSIAAAHGLSAPVNRFLESLILAIDSHVSALACLGGTPWFISGSSRGGIKVIYVTCNAA